jgi:hypothetical protein
VGGASVCCVVTVEVGVVPVEVGAVVEVEPVVDETLDVAAVEVESVVDDTLDVEPVIVEITLLVVSSIEVGVAPAKDAPRTRRKTNASTTVVARAHPCARRQAPNRSRFLFHAAMPVPFPVCRPDTQPHRTTRPHGNPAKG